MWDSFTNTQTQMFPPIFSSTAGCANLCCTNLLPHLIFQPELFCTKHPFHIQFTIHCIIKQIKVNLVLTKPINETVTDYNATINRQTQKI